MHLGPIGRSDYDEPLKRIIVGIVLVLALTVPGVVLTGRLSVLSNPSETSAFALSSTRASAGASKTQIAHSYGRLPLSFIPNAGQADARVRYVAESSGFAVSFTPSEALISFIKGKRGHVLALDFIAASPKATLTARDQLPGTVNYLIGDQADWRTGLPTYSQVVYRGLWPGVDVVFSGGAENLKYEFHLAAGARVSDIRLSYRGADRLALGPTGSLLISTSLGIVSDARPASYQPTGGRRVAVDSSYVLGPDGSYGFALGPGYDPRRPVIVDPALSYSTFLGGTDYEEGNGIAVDQEGNAFVTGATRSLDFPTTPGAFDTTYNGGFTDAFVTKLSREGSAVIYSTFLGGSGLPGEGDVATGIAVDSSGHAYVTGRTPSSDFPTTPGAFDTTYNGLIDVFVTKLSRDGSALVYSTFLGGTGSEYESGSNAGVGIGLDSGGHAYVTGATTSADFPTTPGAFDRTLDALDAFVTKLSAEGSALVYSTFLGGTDGDTGRAVSIAADSAGEASVTGDTGSADFPTTPGAFDRSYNGLGDAFVTKLSSNGSSLVYSTFLGGAFTDHGRGIVVDPMGHAYVTGWTSADLASTSGGFDATFDRDDAFLTKLTPDGSSLVYLTFLGGTSRDATTGIAIDPVGHAYVTGWTESADFPTTPGAFDTTYNGGFRDAFVTKLSADGSALVYSTFLGGTGGETGSAIWVHTGVVSAGHVYVTGSGAISDFPTTPGAFDTTYNGGGDAFVTKFVIGERLTR